MKSNKTVSMRNIIFIWVTWVAIILSFQTLVSLRLAPRFPDRALDWTSDATGPGYQKNHVYLLEEFMNQQVAWDSEYYLGIATGGYDNPQIPALTKFGYTIPANDTRISQLVGPGLRMSLSYAFLPFYPILIHIFALPLGVFGLNPIATATLAGVLVSVLGTLAAMIALADMTRESLGEDGALRAAVYLIIFPTSFFLAQVYTEGLFAGLAFGCLALLQRKKMTLAALLAVAATLTRAVGVTLVIPIAMTWFQTRDWTDLDLEWRQIYHQGLPWAALGRALIAFAPLIAFFIWKFSYLGFAFDYIEGNFFGRGFLNISASFYGWAEALRAVLTSRTQHSAYYITEFFGFFVGLIAIVRCFKINPEIAWFSLAVFLVSWGSGPAQGIHRYILGAPAVFVSLAVWGENPLFDRIWSMVSILILALLTLLFTFNQWVA